MKYYRLPIIALAVICLLLSCKKEELEIPSISPANSAISFLHPAVGQQSLYVLFRGEDIKDDSNFAYEYLPDTLAAEIIAEDENGWLIKEYLTAGSASLNGDNNVAFADSTWYYYLHSDNQRLTIRQWGDYYRTRLFFLEQNSTTGLSLQRIASPATEINGWKTMLPFDEEYTAAMTTGFTMFEEKYDHLNIIIENRPMQEDLPGHTHIFSLEKGLVRSAEYSDYDGRGYGWDALPQ